MEKRTLEQAFNAVFHNKGSFSDFLALDVSKQIEEKSYKGRAVYKPRKEFRNFLRFIDKTLLRFLDKNEQVVHSYVKGKSTLTAVQAHAGSRYFFLTDITEFFSNIKKDDVKRVLTRDKNLIPISDFDSHIDTIASMTTWNDSLPVGFPTSPQLSNGFLLEFDNALFKLCCERNLIYTRYSDDIIVSSRSIEPLKDLKEKIQVILHNNTSDNLYLNSDKTRITHTGNKVKILGLVITPDGRVTIDSKYKNTLESLLYFYINDSDRYADLLCKTFDSEIEKAEHSLFGLLHYVKSTDPSYLDKLQRKYGLYVLRLLMEDRWSDDR